jgi:hypothetical protein
VISLISDGVVVGYYRLSVEDDVMKIESNSITNQRSEVEASMKAIVEFSEVKLGLQKTYFFM